MMQGMKPYSQRFAVSLNHNTIGTVALAQEVFSIRRMTVDVGRSITVQPAVRRLFWDARTRRYGSSLPPHSTHKLPDVAFSWSAPGLPLRLQSPGPVRPWGGTGRDGRLANAVRRRAGDPKARSARTTSVFGLTATRAAGL